MYAGSAPRFDQGVNLAVEGVEAKIAVHVCFGNLHGRSAVRDFREFYPTLRELRAPDRARVRQPRSGRPPLARISDRQGARRRRDRRQGLQERTAAEVAERIRAVLKHVAPIVGSTRTAASGRRRAGWRSRSSPPSSRAPGSSGRSSAGDAHPAADARARVRRGRRLRHAGARGRTSGAGARAPGQAPDPATTPEPVVQVYAARTVGLRGSSRCTRGLW